MRDGESLVHARPGVRVACEGDERRPLRFAQIAAGLAPRLLGRSERADEVVDELEGEAQAAGAREDATGLIVRAGEHGARLERSLERVDGGLVERRVEDVLA
nr:hypothetical protein GCM10025699_32040 [Microbacterium flavescens]